jgi:hypothetical protein
MDNSIVLLLTVPFGMVFGLILIVYEDGVPFSILNKIRCKMGKHKFKTTFKKVHKYYCQNCGKPRSHPVLKLVAGSNKVRDNGYKF